MYRLESDDSVLLDRDYIDSEGTNYLKRVNGTELRIPVIIVPFNRPKDGIKMWLEFGVEAVNLSWRFNDK